MSGCTRCPWTCKVPSGGRGSCGVGAAPRLSGYSVRYREDSWISGQWGSGMIFLSGCHLRCRFCQNYDISIRGDGRDTSVAELADIMLQFQEWRCHNVHWVTPTHQLPWLLEALENARGRGLTLPLVYNTGGYETVETLRPLEGVVDIYLPDFKIWDDALAWKYLRVRNYPEVTRQALAEMKRQVGDLVLDANRVATRGLLVRHLVMPGMLEDARHILQWIARELGPQTYVNVLPYYKPFYRAEKYPEIARATTPEEWRQAMHLAHAAGLVNLHEYRSPRLRARPTRPQVEPAFTRKRGTDTIFVPRDAGAPRRHPSTPPRESRQVPRTSGV